VAAHNLLTRSEITLENVQALMGRRVDPTRLSLDHIVEAVARYYHMMPSDIKSPSRSKDVSHARQVAIYIIRDLTEASFPKIGELLGGRKHTTILYAFEKMREELQHQPLLARQVQEITQRLKAGMP
jgi:chromosomal replication initiator protein